MNFSIFDHRRMRQAIALALLSGTLLCIFPPDHPLLRNLANQAVFVSIGYLALGLFFFLINRARLMFVCMGCCAAICFYYLEAAPDQSQNVIETLKVAPAADSLGKNIIHLQ